MDILTRRQIPNFLTILRFLFIPPIFLLLVNKEYQIALFLFVIAGATDSLDGYLARRYKWKSRFGSIADPLADRAILLSTLLALTVDCVLPVWLFSLIIFRDTWIVLGALAYHHLISTYEMAPSWSGKAYTFFQLALVSLVLFSEVFISLPDLVITICIYAVGAVAVISTLEYTFVWGKKAFAAETSKIFK